MDAAICSPYVYYISSTSAIYPEYSLIVSANLSPHMHIRSLLHQQYIPIILLCNQQSVSSYVTRSPLHQQYTPTILSWTQQSVSSYVYYFSPTSAIYPNYSLMDAAICLIICLLYLQHINNVSRLLSHSISKSVFLYAY